MSGSVEPRLISGTSGTTGAGFVPTPPGAGESLISSGNTPGAYGWSFLQKISPNPTTISATTAVLSINNGSNRIDASANAVALTFPAVAIVPFDGFGFRIWFAKTVNNGTLYITLAVDGAAGEKLQNPDTGAYQTGTWSSQPSGTLQGRSLWCEWWAAGNAWLING